MAQGESGGLQRPPRNPKPWLFPVQSQPLARDLIPNESHVMAMPLRSRIGRGILEGWKRRLSVAVTMVGERSSECRDCGFLAENSSTGETSSAEPELGVTVSTSSRAGLGDRKARTPDTQQYRYAVALVGAGTKCRRRADLDWPTSR
ncbi:hypothetical protein FOPE_12609 [Fonsecaea pedrosoi]|nr:hypothetical protein FOPE_12609 [Fonsecaea pedrosoi]